MQAISSFFPSLLSGFEEDIIELLKEDNEVLKEGIAHVLSKAGGYIREQLASSRCSCLKVLHFVHYFTLFWNSCRATYHDYGTKLLYLSIFSSVALLLERLCLEGTRKQAKYSVHALAAITKDDGLMALSVLYKV